MKNLLHIILITFPIILTAQNWILTNTDTTDDILYISFKDENLGFFLTDSGKIFRSQDSGDNWELIYQNTEMNFGNIVATNDSLIWYTYDNTIPTRVAFSLQTFDFTKETIDILPIKPKFWKDEIWDVDKVNQKIGGGDPNNVVEDYILSDDYIWTSNAYKIYSSDDFGITWQEHPFNIFHFHSPYQSYYDGTNNMVAITHYGTAIHKTTDGNNWSYNDNVPAGIYFYFIDYNRYLAYK